MLSRLRQRGLPRVERQPGALPVALEPRGGGGQSPVLRAQLLVRGHHVVHFLAVAAQLEIETKD